MKKNLTIEIPDTLDLAIEAGNCLPFGLWEIVEQPLLYHWFDYAVDHGFAAVEIQSPSNIIEVVCRAVDAATLWPIDLQVVEKNEESEPAFPVSRLPQAEGPPTPPLESGLDLLVLKQQLVRIRLDYIWERIVPEHSYYPIGRNNYLHPDTLIDGPYWIGNDCVINEGAYIGPYTCIGSNTIIDRNVSIENSTIASGITIHSGLTFGAHDISGERIFNHHKNIIHSHIGRGVITPAKN